VKFVRNMELHGAESEAGARCTEQTERLPSDLLTEYYSEVHT
jgi:hypothetical protein